MFASAILAASIVCTSQISPSGDPHSLEYVNRITIDLESSTAELKEYRFEAFELWGVDDLEELLTDDSMNAPTKTLEVEVITNFDPKETSTSYELYSTNNWQWTLDSILKVNEKSGERTIKNGARTYVEKMDCK